MNAISTECKLLFWPVVERQCTTFVALVLHGQVACAVCLQIDVCVVYANATMPWVCVGSAVVMWMTCDDAMDFVMGCIPEIQLCTTAT